MQAYFEHLDHSGGFFYERWGDAPVHSLAAAMFLNASEVSSDFSPVKHCFDALHGTSSTPSISSISSCLRSLDAGY